MCVRRDLSSGCVTAAAALLQACAKFLEASSAYVASHAPSRAPARAGEVPVTQDPRAHPPGFTGRQGTAIFDAPLCVPLPLQARRLAEADCGVAASRFVVTTLTQLVHRGTRIFFAEVVSTLHSNAWHRLPDGFSVCRKAQGAFSSQRGQAGPHKRADQCREKRVQQPSSIGRHLDVRSLHLRARLTGVPKPRARLAGPQVPGQPVQVASDVAASRVRPRVHAPR